MEITREMLCPICNSALHVSEHEFFDLNAVIVGCRSCRTFAVVGDDRFLSCQDTSLDHVRQKLRKRAETLEENRKAAANRYVEVKR